MHAAILQLDDSLSRQTSLQAAVRDNGGRIAQAGDLGPLLRLWTLQRTLDRLKDRLKSELPPRGEAQLLFAGSGDFHHVTPLLIERAAEAYGLPVTVLHFDNHPDWMRQAPGRHCGSWVGRAARLCDVEKVITIGVSSRDIGARRAGQGDLSLIAEQRLELYAWTNPDGGDLVQLGNRSWPTISALGEAAFLEVLDATVTTAAVYVTIDKDVLRANDAVTNWDQGAASLDFVLSAIERVLYGRKLVGADIVGDWSEPVYGGGMAERVLKCGEAFLDQPRGPVDAACAAAVNEAVNLRLLRMFEAAA